MMRGGLVYSDYITTVSNSYAWEIQTPEFGEGLQDILKWRQDRLWGIINGIDYKTWNPSTDKNISETYTIKDRKSKRKKNKAELQKEVGLAENPDVLTLAIVSRLTDQKGLDIIDQVMDQIRYLHEEFGVAIDVIYSLYTMMPTELYDGLVTSLEDEFSIF